MGRFLAKWFSAHTSCGPFSPKQRERFLTPYLKPPRMNGQTKSRASFGFQPHRFANNRRFVTQHSANIFLVSNLCIFSVSSLVHWFPTSRVIVICNYAENSRATSVLSHHWLVCVRDMFAKTSLEFQACAATFTISLLICWLNLGRSGELHTCCERHFSDGLQFF